MPTSPYSQIPVLVDFLCYTRPNSLLDIGLGNGKLGFVARDVLDVTLNNIYRSEDWRVRIDGIEIHKAYIQNHQMAIYNNIFIGDAFAILPELDGYDMVIVGDVLEHFEKELAWEFFDRCMAQSHRHMILNVPLGKGWQQEAIYGNPYECHRSFWEWSEFEPFTCKYKILEFNQGHYACCLIRKEDYIDYKIEQLTQKV